jgi:hypothetical protein
LGLGGPRAKPTVCGSLRARRTISILLADIASPHWWDTPEREAEWNEESSDGYEARGASFEGSWHDSYPPSCCVSCSSAEWACCAPSHDGRCGRPTARRAIFAAHVRIGVLTPFLAARCKRVHTDYVRVAFSPADSRAARDRSCPAPPLAHLGAHRPPSRLTSRQSAPTVRKQRGRLTHAC